MTEIVERAVQDLVPYARNPRKNDAVGTADGGF
jgi:hypothetical protein